MKNKLQFFFLYLIYSFLIVSHSYSNEQFIFNITEIEITKNGNQVNGYKGGTATSDDGSEIVAENFLYNKTANILEATGDVKYINKSKDIIIFSDKVTYFKNDEKIITEGNSKAIDQKNTITASDFEYDKILNIIKAKKNVEMIDLEKDTKIYADDVTYFKNDEKIITKGNSKAIDQKNTITASDFEYDKILNIIKAKKNVEMIDLEKDTKIYADDVTYFKNDEKIITKGNTSALVEKKYNFKSKNVLYLRNTSELSSDKKSLVEDNEGNFYELDSFNYLINKKLLTGKNVIITSNYEGNKTDKYFFSEGLFNFIDKSFISKETKIKVDKNIFGNEEQDPRLYGVSSYGNSEKTVVKKGIFTSCKIRDDCPPWSISSEEIIHDKIKRDIIYKNAFLKIYDVPVFYFPKFFHPDPTVDRRTGFLQPQFNNSNILGSSIFIPYFKAISHDSDYTFKPTIFEDGKFILQNEFRKEYEDSSLITDFSLSRGYKSSSVDKRKSISHLFLDYNQDLQLPNYLESKMNIKVEKVNNDTYLKVFQNNLFPSPVMPENKDLMSSYVGLYLEKENYNLSSGFSVYEKLKGQNSDRYQYVFPYYNFYKDLTSENIDGSINFRSSGSNDLVDTNNLTTSIVNNIEFDSINYISQKGFTNNFGIYFKNSATIAKNDSTYSSKPQIDGFGIFNMESSFPLSKTHETKAEFLTPKISFRINPGNNMKNHSSANKLITAGNIFSINRLGITNSYEAGKSLTLGIDYKIDQIEIESSEDEDIKDKYLSFQLATVIRDTEESAIPISSTINRKNSNLFASINNNLLDNINLGYDFSVDNDLKTISSHNINTEISINNFVTTFNFIEQRNEIGTTHMLYNTTEYKIDDSNSLKFSTSRNKEISLTEYYDLSYEYKNDCLTAALKFNKTFYKDNDFKPTEDLFFTISLIPLTTYEKQIYRTGQGWFK